VIDRAEAVRLFERRRSAWLTKDFETYMNLFHPDLVFQGPSGEPSNGRNAYADLVLRSYDAIEPISFEIKEIAVHGSRVLAEAEISLRFKANGQLVSYPLMSICEIREGLITWWREYYDPAQLQPASVVNVRTGGRQNRRG